MATSELTVIPSVDELKLMPVDEIVATFNKEEREIYEHYRKEVHGEIEHTLMWYYSMGAYTATVYAKVKKDQGETTKGKERKRVYNARLFERLTLALRLGEEPRWFRNVMSLVRAWDTRAKFRKAIVLPRGPSGNRLSYTHAMHLAGIDDVKIRDELRQCALDEELTSGALYDRIQELVPGRGQRKIGRTPAIPSSAAQCLSNVLGMTDSMLQKYEHAWMGEEFDLKAAFSEIPPDRLDASTLERIKAAREKVTLLSDWTSRMGRLLLELEADAERKMAVQAEMRNGDVNGHVEDDVVSLAEHRRKQEKAKAAGKKAAKKKGAKAQRPTKKKAPRKRPGVKK